MSFRQLPIPATTSRYWEFRGGLDQTSPSISMPAGRLRSSSNVEVGSNGAYQVTQGYERFSGQSKPSDATYSIIEATITGSYALGNTLTGATSGATSVIIAATAGYFVVTKVVGTYQSGEDLQIAAVTIAVASSADQQSAASTPALNATYKNLAADEYRDDITAVPGSGSVLGVWKYAGSTYAIRNNAGGTAAVMHKQSTSGWTSVNLGREVAFTSGGATEIVAGNTITGATSGATAVVGTIVRTSGSWAAGTAAGFIYFASQTGTFQAENLNVGASLNLATIAGNSSAVSLTASGRYEFINVNFGGGAGTTKMYAASGVHKAFQFDGTNFAFITTGMTSDTPSHVSEHKNHLFLSFGSSVQHSGTGDPLSWTVVTGAGEIGVGDTLTNFIKVPGDGSGGALVLQARNRTKVLYGNDSTDWNLVDYNPDAGGLAWTGQWLGQGVYLDDLGLTTLSASQRFGNFDEADIAEQVRPYLNDLRTSAIASCVVRRKSQYRVFFSGGDAMYVTFQGGKAIGLMPITLADPVTCVCSLEGASGEEEIFFGSTDGFVYQMDRGTSQDGEAITYSAQLAYNHFGGPRQLKTFRKAVLEVSGSGYAVFNVGYSLGYGTTDLPQDASSNVTASLSATQWDSFTWDQFFWDGRTLLPGEVDLDGTAENISLVFSGSSDEYESLTFNGAIVDYAQRRALR
jgi:hypothetical protein